MKKLILSLSTLFLLSQIVAQSNNINCDGERFIKQVFPEEPIMTTVKFGENTTIGGNFQELYMDVFEPAGDDAEFRPVLLTAFGGSFINGDRTATHDICKAFAKKGFVTAAIDYRLYDRPFPPEGAFPDSLDMMEVVINSVHDYKAAIRYLRKDAATNNLFRIDPDYIFNSGYSAGSISALHTAYLDEGESPDYVQNIIDAHGGLEGSTDNPEDSNLTYSSEVQGVVNYFGALHKKEFMDENDPPLISIHGDMDPIVPYGYGFAVVIIIPIMTLEGSGALHPYADSLGLVNELITVEGGGHGDFSAEKYMEMAIKASIFLENILCNNVANSHDFSMQNELSAYPNPSRDKILVKFEGQAPTFDYSVISIDGKEVIKKTNCNQSEIEIYQDITGPGIFVLNIRFNDPNIQAVNKKIVFVQ